MKTLALSLLTIALFGLYVYSQDQIILLFAVIAIGTTMLNV